jgi:hypothetical protein
MRWLVHGDRLEASTVFGLVLESSHWLLGFPGDEVDDTQVGPCRGCVVRSFLCGGIFPRGSEVDGPAYPPHRPMNCSYQLRGQDLHVRRCPVLTLLIGNGACWEEETSWGIVI